MNFWDENGKPFVCKLKKSLYGLKQSGRNWFLTLKAFLITLRFVNSFHDEYLFIKKQDEKIVGILCLWGDDLIICGLSENFCDWFYVEISKKFKISDYSELTWFLGMKIERTSAEIKIRQEKYIEKILETFKMNDCRPIGTPLEENCKLSKNDCPQGGGMRSNLE